MARLKPISGATGHILRAAGMGLECAIKSERPGFTLWAVSYATGARLGALRVARVSE
jgi:hypothetical protein